MCLRYCNMIWGLSIIIILLSNSLSVTSTDTDPENAKNKKKHEICSLPLLVGGNKCKSPSTPERRFYYNKDVKCAQFDYGGCDGNENNFKTMEDCKQMCEDHDHSLHEHGLQNQNQNQTVKKSNDNQALVTGATTTITSTPRSIQNSAKGILDAKYVGILTGVNIVISLVTAKLLL